MTTITNKEQLNQVAQRLKANDESLTKLYIGFMLNKDFFNCKRFKELAQALKLNNSLKWLFIDTSDISDTGMEELSQALKVNKGLTDLCLSHNEISMKGLKELAEALKVNEKLDLHLKLLT